MCNTWDDLSFANKGSEAKGRTTSLITCSVVSSRLARSAGCALKRSHRVKFLLPMLMGGQHGKPVYIISLMRLSAHKRCGWLDRQKSEVGWRYHACRRHAAAIAPAEISASLPRQRQHAKDCTPPQQ